MASRQTQPRAIAVDERSVYWTDAGWNEGNDGAVMKVAIGGGTAEQLAWFQNGARGLAIAASGIYWVTHADGDNGRVLGLSPR